MSASGYPELTYVVDGPVATVTLNRPDNMNAFTTRMAWSIVRVFEEIDRDDDVRVVIVTGAGRAFCAGADLSEGGATFEKIREAGVRGDVGGLASLRIYECTKPVIAAINGAAVGIGATLTLPMDVRMAAEGAKIGFVFNRRGLVPEAGSSFFLPRVVGISQAMEWVATGRVMRTDEALRGGLLRSVHPADELLPAARELAREIADNAAPVSVALSRKMLWSMLGASDPYHAHRAESRALAARGVSADVREGVDAFFEKRAPNHPDRISDGLPVVLDGPDAPQVGPYPEP